MTKHDKQAATKKHQPKQQEQNQRLTTKQNNQHKQQQTHTDKTKDDKHDLDNPTNTNGGGRCRRLPDPTLLVVIRCLLNGLCVCLCCLFKTHKKTHKNNKLKHNSHVCKKNKVEYHD